MRTLLLTALMAFAATATSVTAQSTSASGILVTHPFARATPNGATTGAAYLDVQAAPGKADTLVGVQSPASARAEIHTHTMVGDVMQMRRVDSVEVPAGGTLTLTPQGNHIMLLDLKAPLRSGDRVHLTLTFKTAGTVEVDVPVIALGAMAPATIDHAAH